MILRGVNCCGWQLAGRRCTARTVCSQTAQLSRRPQPPHSLCALFQKQVQLRSSNKTERLFGSASRSVVATFLKRPTATRVVFTAQLSMRRHYVTSSSSPSRNSSLPYNSKDEQEASDSCVSNNPNDSSNFSKFEEAAHDSAFRTTLPWAISEESVDNSCAGLDGDPNPAAVQPDTAAAATATTARLNVKTNVELVSTDTNTNLSVGEESAIEEPIGTAVQSAALEPDSNSLTDRANKANDDLYAPTEGIPEPLTAEATEPLMFSSLRQPQQSAGVSACRSLWDDGGAGLVRRRVAQWYVPGLERERRRSPSEAPAPSVKSATAVSEVVNAVSTGANKEYRQEAEANTTISVEKTNHTQGGESKAEERYAKDANEVAADATNKVSASVFYSEVKAMPTATSATDASAKTAEAAKKIGATATRVVCAASDGASSANTLSSSEQSFSSPAPITVAAVAGTVAKADTAPSTKAETESSTKEEEVKKVSNIAENRGTQGTTAKAPAAALHPTTAAVPLQSNGTCEEKTPTATTLHNTQGDKTQPTSDKEAKKDDNHEDEDEDEELPRTLLTVQANRNKRIKRLLMASLGSDFAKAGLNNDGVRTSFSIVNYQTIKQLTGLSRIPSTLLISCLVAPGNEFNWIDISMHPTATLSEYKEALEEVLLGLGMHRTMVEDSAEPMLLPQVTVVKGCYSLLMRYAIEAPADKQMDSFQDLTNRFTVFLSQGRIITVHRTQCSYVEELKLSWPQRLSADNLDGTSQAAHRNTNGDFTLDANNNDSKPSTPRGLRYVLHYFVKETIGTFTQAIAKCIVEFDRYEANLFNTQCNRSSMARDIYHIKRRASVYARTLTLTQDAYAHIATALHISYVQVGYQEIMHDLVHVKSLAEELNSNADSVLQLLFQLSSYQVNELMRVLTVFSAFFIPLSFIASVYGMNFEDLPMLHHEYGGVFCAVLMCTVATCIFVWFRFNRFV